MAHKKVAIVGRGRLVGKPLEKMWQASGIDVTVFEKGDDLGGLINYDLIVSATGVSSLIKPSMIKSGVVIVDAGTASEKGKISGDVAPDIREMSDITITPEKGGVGPLTGAGLFVNVLLAALQKIQK